MSFPEPENDRLPQVVYRTLDWVDDLPKPLRRCVHEYGPDLVRTMVNIGITKASHIDLLVKEVVHGARQPHQRQGRTIGDRSERGTPVAAHLDWLLIQAGAGITAARLIRLMASNGLLIVPIEPNELMVETSIAETGKLGLCSKQQKHRARLRAANHAAAKRLWPSLRGGA